MEKRKLLKLAALLDTVPSRKFDMGTWGSANSSAANEPKCATRACALGWATAIPEFNKAGLQLIVNEAFPRDGIVHYKDELGASAGAEFFGLDEDQADYLFHYGADDPKGKAAEIRKLVRTGKIPEEWCGE